LPRDHENDYDCYEEFWGRRPVRRQQKKYKGRFWFFIAFGILLFVAAAYAAYQYSDDILRQAAQRIAGQPPAPDIIKESRPAILLIGTDQRAKEPARADTIMVAFIDPRESRVQVLSIPRDTYAEIPGRNVGKLSHAHAFGGARLLTETVANLLGVPISKYVQVNFDAFRSVIDVLGGVEYEVERRMYYPPEGIDLRPGRQVLDGDKALQFVRYRSDGDDLTRIRRQQEFLAALSQQAMSVATVLKLPRLAAEVYGHVNTNLGLPEIVGLGKIFLEAGTANLETVMLPGNYRTINGLSYWMPSEARTRELIEKITAPPAPPT
jgi:LCP family protein required for cell wall assembly